MRIGIDISQIVYQTGVSRYTVELVENLLKIDQENQYVLWAGSLRQRSLIKAFAAKLPRKVKLVLTPLSPKLADWAFNRLDLPLGLENIDVFHASNWTIPRMNCPVVTTIHDLTFLKFPDEHLPYYVAAHKSHLERAKAKAAAVIAVSQATKRDLIDQGFLTDKVQVIYEAASAMFKPIKTKRQPFILSVGTQEPRKNIQRLIEAWRPLKRRYELVITGKFGWGERTKPIKGVRLLGFVSDEELVKLYCQTQVFVYPSLYEGFGLPVLEAMACGCPVVTSGVSSLPEIGGEAAVYVEPTSVTSITQGIKIALEQSAKLRRLGLEQAKQFSWEKTARETLKIYRQVYENRP